MSNTKDEAIMLLCLRQVARFHGPRLIFKDVSLSVRSGSVTLLAGANGAGKSTLLKIMAGLIRPSSGVVERDGGPDYEEGAASESAPDNEPEHSKADRAAPLRDPVIGYLGHQTFLYPGLSALENLAFWSALHGKDTRRETLLSALARVELTPFAEEKAGGFSRGMAQRLNLARIFLLSPDLLLLDEPGTGLDTRATAVLHREVAAARERGAGVVWITHTLDADLDRADMVALLEKKRLARYCSVREYRASPKNIAETPSIAGNVEVSSCCPPC